MTGVRKWEKCLRMGGGTEKREGLGRHLPFGGFFNQMILYSNPLSPELNIFFRFAIPSFIIFSVFSEYLVSRKIKGTTHIRFSVT